MKYLNALILYISALRVREPKLGEIFQKATKFGDTKFGEISTIWFPRALATAKAYDYLNRLVSMTNNANVPSAAKMRMDPCLESVS